MESVPFFSKENWNAFLFWLSREIKTRVYQTHYQ